MSQKPLHFRKYLRIFIKNLNIFAKNMKNLQRTRCSKFLYVFQKHTKNCKKNTA